MCGLWEDVEDIKAVVAYLTSQLGYRIDLVVAHSRASIVAMKWLAITPEGRDVRGFVNVSARYRMWVSLSGTFVLLSFDGRLTTNRFVTEDKQ